MTEKEKVAAIRRLNDGLRRYRTGGRVFITRGIQVLDEKTMAAVMEAMSAFDAFTEDNDPHGEHDCALLTVDGVKVLWKIDYYDPSGEFGSEDPSDPAKTKRVLTLMLASEY